jgi:hypothetical protein
MAKKDQTAADQSDPALEATEPAADAKLADVKPAGPSAAAPEATLPADAQPAALPPGSLALSGGMVTATPSADGGPAPLPEGMKRFRLTTPAGEQEEFVATCVQDAIRMRNGDGRGKVYTKKQLQVEVLEG